MLEPGHYWVQIFPGSLWEVAFYQTAGRWLFMGYAPTKLLKPYKIGDKIEDKIDASN